MRIVELFGPSGVGKSTIYSHMLRTGHFTRNPKIPYNDALGFIDQHQDCSKFCAYLQYIFDTAKPDDRKEKRRSGTVRALGKIALARTDLNAHPPIVVDGGLIHRAQGIERMGFDYEHYLKKMPLPDLAIYVRGDLGEIVSRNHSRAQDPNFDDRSGESERSIAVAEKALEIISARRCDYLLVDAKQEPFYNAQAILSSLTVTGSTSPSLFRGETPEQYDKKRLGQRKWAAEQEIVEDMLSDIAYGDWVLDAPCGTGRFFAFYQKQGFIVRGLDISDDMIAEATKKVTPENVNRFSFAKADIRSTGLKDKSVDAAVMCRLTRWLSPEDCWRAFSELQRVARKKIIFTARVANHPHARTYEMIDSWLSGWKIHRDEAGSEEDYRIIELRPE